MCKIFIKYHLGLGDCIIHNGMVRKVVTDHPNCQVFVSCKPHNYENIKFMYKDEPRINILKLDDRGTNQHLATTKYDIVISSHFEFGTKFDYTLYGDDAFYLHAGFDPKVRTENFYVKRDYEKEKFLFEKLTKEIGTEKYIFIHEKPEQNIVINRSKLNSDLPIILAKPEYNFFDLLTLIEKSEEVHVISSCFLSFFMVKKLNEKTFAHMYADRSELTDMVKKNGINVIL
jgi:hypothetical protein